MTIDNYCSQKFWWLSVDLEKRQTLSCCAATPHKIDFDWLTQNPGEIFNSPQLIQERSLMLDGRGLEVASCDPTCWKAEQTGLASRRLLSGSDALTHISVHSSPEILHVIVGTDCNLSCSYCCKQYSSAWAQDINLQGNYRVITPDDRYIMTDRDRVLIGLSQKQLAQGQTMSCLIDEIGKICHEDSLEEVNITGGEPFLYLALESLMSRIPDTLTCSIFTGLGVNTKRLKQELEKIRHRKNLNIVISGENTYQHYEFNRFGHSYDRFMTNIKIIEDSGIPYSFHATLSNLTVFDLANFYRLYGHRSITFAPCNDPDFLAMHVMDSESKSLIMSTIAGLPLDIQDQIHTAITADPTQQQVDNARSFVYEFTKRRALDLHHYPESFRTWLLHE